MTEPMVSVVVPVYHPEKEYMDRLLDSIVRQTIGIENIQLILVSDGDKSKETQHILSCWEEKYPENILVICYDENMGPGYARTMGIEYATGKYIAFADQDDWLSLEMYRVLTEKAEEYSTEITGGFSFRERQYTPPEVERQYTGGEDVFWEINDSDDRRKYLMTSIRDGYWCSIYRRDFLQENEIFFPAGITYDDNFFGLLCDFHVKRVLIVGEYFYHWYYNAQSISMRENGTTHFDRLQVELMGLDELKKRGFFQTYHAEIEWHFLLIYFFNTWHTFFFHMDYIPYDVYLDMCRTVKKEFPAYRDNPYLSCGVDKFEWYTWSCYPIVNNYWTEQGHQENIDYLQQVPEKLRDVSWLDLITGDLTQVDLTWFKVIYLLFPLNQ